MSRSHSLPSLPQDLLRTFPCSVHQQPQVVYSDAPLTPPLSPKPDQGLDSQGLCPAITHQFIHPDKGVHVPSELMDVDKETVDDDSDMSHAPPPRRFLEDEAVRLTRSNIKLSHFEVRGTLGAH